MRCAAIRCSRWRSIFRPSIGSCARSRQYRGWRNLPDVRAVLRMGRAMVDLYCESFATVPKRITLDIDDTFDAVHGGQQLRLFNAHYDEYGFQPIVVFDGEGRFVTAVLRPAKRPSDKEIKPFLGACCARSALTGLAPRSCCGPTATIAVPRFSIGVAPMASITSSASRQPRHCAAMSKVSKPARRRDSRPRRETASFVVSWSSSTARKAGAGSSGSSPGSKRAKDRHPLRRHQSEQPQRSRALRGCLLPARPGRKPYQVLEDPSGGGSHVLLQGDSQPVSAVPACGRLLADVGPTRVDAKAFDVARRPVRHVAPPPHQDCRPREMKTMIRVHLPTSCPAQDILRFALGRIPRLVT